MTDTLLGQAGPLSAFIGDAEATFERVFSRRQNGSRSALAADTIESLPGDTASGRLDSANRPVDVLSNAGEVDDG